MKSESDSLIEAGVAALGLRFLKHRLHGRTVSNCIFSAVEDKYGTWLKITHRGHKNCETYVIIRPPPQEIHGKPGLSFEQYAIFRLWLLKNRMKDGAK